MIRGAFMVLATFAPWAAAEPPREALRFSPIGPQGGDVRSLARDPGDPRRVYAGTVDGILYASLNAGASWSRLEPGFPLRGASLDDILVTEKGDLFVSFWKIDGSGGGSVLMPVFAIWRRMWSIRGPARCRRG